MLSVPLQRYFWPWVSSDIVMDKVAVLLGLKDGRSASEGVSGSIHATCVTSSGKAHFRVIFVSSELITKKALSPVEGGKVYRCGVY